MFSSDFAAIVLGRGVGGDVNELLIRKRRCLTRTQLDVCLDQYGTMPLPPYIARPDGIKDSDKQNYQTMFAKHRGAVAAPTAGLPFYSRPVRQYFENGR